MARQESNPNFMNGVPELLILRLLAEKEMYGYELVQAIRARTHEAITAGEGVVYPVLHALEREGALTSRRKKVAGRSRIYYSATRAGLRRLKELRSAWASVAQGIDKVFAGGRYGEAVS